MLVPLRLPSPPSLRRAFSVHSLVYNSSKTTSECPHDLDFLISCSSMVDLKCCVTTTQNLWDTVKAVLRGRFIALQAYLKKQEKSQINNLTLHLKQLEKEAMKNPRVSRRK